MFMIVYNRSVVILTGFYLEKKSKTTVEVVLGLAPQCNVNEAVAYMLISFSHPVKVISRELFASTRNIFTF